mmetsp:Transcript_3153/g.12889  ORF Transcript_3153/g.12889 Transcript_3153/m.12889 type:complete len:115 (+) Transcript_3153:869-1213(+)
MGYWAFAQPRINTATREILDVEVGIDHRAAFGDDGDGDDGDGDGSSDGVGRGEKTGRRDEVRRVRYVGRPAAASPATGSPAIHAAETRALVHEALGLEHVGIHLAEPRSSVPRY